MNLNTSPLPPKWPFFLGDGLLLALACTIGVLSPAPLSTTALSLVFGCVALGAVLAVIPYLLDFATAKRADDEALRLKLEEQNKKLLLATESLAATAAQIKSAHEAAHRAVHTAETLPYRLQEKIGEFTNQLQERDDEEKAAMAKELELLRDSEGQRLTSLVSTIQKAIKEFTALEQTTRSALDAARNQNAEVAPRLTEATSRAEICLRQASTQLQGAIDATESRTRDTLAATEAAATRLLERTAALRQLEQELDTGLQNKIEQLRAAADAIGAATALALETSSRTDVSLRTTGESAEASDVAHTPSATLPVMQLTAFPRMKRDPFPPRPAESPVAAAATETAPESEPASDSSVATEPPPKREPRRKSTTRSVGEAVLPGFAEPEIVYDTEPTSHSSPAKTSDGTTRLLVTAYVGIGNKIFIRGEGPGLSWEKGVPLEFVSIGKWSWETNDATDPVKIQLFKNDDLPAQGEAITIPSGHHVETTPVFREPDPF